MDAGIFTISEEAYDTGIISRSSFFVFKRISKSPFCCTNLLSEA
jgi:hypothetical protein